MTLHILDTNLTNHQFLTSPARFRGKYPFECGERMH